MTRFLSQYDILVRSCCWCILCNQESSPDAQAVAALLQAGERSDGIVSVRAEFTEIVMVQGNVGTVRVLEERLRNARFAQIRGRHDLGLLREDDVIGIQFEEDESVSPFDIFRSGKTSVGHRGIRLKTDIPAAVLDAEILFAVVVLRAAAVDVPRDIDGLRHLDVEILVAGDAFLRKRRTNDVPMSAVLWAK